MVDAGSNVAKEDAWPLFSWVSLCDSHPGCVCVELRSPERQLKEERPREPDVANGLTIADSIWLYSDSLAPGQQEHVLLYRWVSLELLGCPWPHS